MKLFSLKFFFLIYIDVAISMPFGNHDSSNLVHIYRGSKDGLIIKPSQVIKKNYI
jgi:hypothetical protein